MSPFIINNQKILPLLMQKSKQISKQPHQKPIPHSHKARKPKKPITNQQGDPLIKNISDFVTSIKINYSSKPIYTGGRILAMGRHVYASCNGEISVYNFEKSDIVDKIKHTNEEIVNFCVSPDEKYIVTFTQNSMVRVLVLESKKVLHTVKMNNNFANDIQFSSDGRHLAFALGNSIHIFTFETMKRTHSYNPTNSKFAVTKLQWHPNPEKLQIVSCDMQRNLALFDYIVNKVVAVSEAGDGATQFCISADGEILVAVNNLELKFYELKSLNLKNKVQMEQYFQTLYATDNQIFIGGQETQLYSFSPSNPAKLKVHKNCTDNGVAKIMRIGTSTSTLSRLLILSTEQNITVARVEKNGLQCQGMIVGFNDEIIDIKNSKKGNEEGVESPYFALVTNSNNVKIINKDTKRLEFLVKGHTNTVLSADYWHPYLATAGKDNVLKLWRVNETKKDADLLANYNGHSGDILSLVALPQSKIIATVSEDLTIKLWSMCLQVQQKVEIKSAIRTAIAHQKSINAVRASPDEDLLVTCSQDRTLKLWNQHLTNVMTLQGHKRGVWDASFHPVEKMLVSAGGDGMLKGWSLETGECLWSIGEGAALIRCSWIYYNQVVTGSLSGIVKIWDIRKQTSLSYDKHEGKIWALDVAKNGDKAQIYSGATDSVYHIWEDNTEAMKQTIMHEHELEQQQRIFYDQHMSDKRYCESAVIAFRANYTKLFLTAVEKIGVSFDADIGVDFDAEGKLMVNEAEQQEHVTTQEEFGAMVSQLKQIDQTRLLLNIQSMTSTVKLYKIGNRILLQLLKTTKLSELAALNSSFFLPDSTTEDLNQFNEKKSGFVKWLQGMIGYEQKHLTRLQKYTRGTHWIEHLYRIDQPFAA